MDSLDDDDRRKMFFRGKIKKVACNALLHMAVVWTPGLHQIYISDEREQSRRREGIG